MADRYLGYRPADRERAPWASFFNPDMAAFQPHVEDALLAGGMAHELFPSVAAARRMQDEGYWEVETGYARMPGGGFSMFCLTEMPGITPAMWEWWFGWHGDDPAKYKLWHPRAHVHVAWKDGRRGFESHVGRVSHITEYIGSERIDGAIGFVPPSALGLDEALLKETGEVVVCARIGLPNTPIKGGWLLHHVRPVAGGSEMRSRMWMGGSNTAIGDDPGPVQSGLAAVLRPLSRLLLPEPAELLAHNAQEMAHLAGFLDALYAEFGPAAENNARM